MSEHITCETIASFKTEGNAAIVPADPGDSAPKRGRWDSFDYPEAPRATGTPDTPPVRRSRWLLWVTSAAVASAVASGAWFFFT